MMTRETHRVAVILFCEAKGADEHDAGHGAEMAIRHALAGGKLRQVGYQMEPWPAEVGFVRGDGLEMVTRVVRIVEAGTAFGNGYLWSRPTARAWREGGR